MSTVLKIVLGILIAALLLIGGCVALIGVGLEGVDEEFDKQQAESAISNGAARSIENGTSKSDVIEELGRPRSTDESDVEGLGKSECIYYGVEGGDALTQWQFCFDGKDRLESKMRL